MMSHFDGMACGDMSIDHFNQKRHYTRLPHSEDSKLGHSEHVLSDAISGIVTSLNVWHGYSEPPGARAEMRGRAGRGRRWELMLGGRGRGGNKWWNQVWE
jgi:hypothetical protein